MTGDHYLKTAVNSFGESEPPNTAVANCGTSICLMAEPLDDANMGRIDETRPDGMTFRSTTAVPPSPERPITDQTATEEDVASLTAAAVTQLAAAGTLQTTVIDYDYDPLYRLTGANYTGAITATYAYDYDAVGNMTAYTETVGGETTYVGRTFDAANQLLTSYDGSETTDYGYDNNGNLLAVTQAAPLVPGSKVGQGYSYDQRNLLRIGYTIGPVNTLDVDFIYDGDGNRLQQIDHTGSKSITTTYTNDNTGLSQVLVADDGTEQVYNLYGLDLLAQDDGTETRTLLADGLGSVRAEMVGSAVETVTTYRPYGKLLAQTGDSGTTYGFTGEQHDGVTGLVYLRARYYSPYLNQFLVKDAWAGDLLRPETLYPYNYVGGNVINLTDPSGHCYGPLRYLRQLEGTNCANLDMAGRIFTNPNASVAQRGFAATYATAMAGSHAMLAAGTAASGGFGQALVGYVAGYGGYDSLRRNTSSRLLTVPGYILGYENIHHDLITLHTPCASTSQRLLAGGDVLLNTVLGASGFAGAANGVRSIKAAWQMRNMSSAARLAYIQRIAAKSGVELGEGNGFYRTIGKRRIEYPVEALDDAWRLSGGFYHEMAHVGQEFGTLGRIAKPLQQLSVRVEKSVVGFIPGYLLNPVEVNAFSSGLAYWANWLGFGESRVFAYGINRLVNHVLEQR